MQLKHSIAIALVACGAALQSCQQDRINVTDAKELYTRDFIKQFGIADPNHDWNMATRGGVSVTTSTPTNVKVYAKVGGKRYLFADYKNVNGTEAIEFDIPKGVDQLIVHANGRDYSVNNGASIDLRRSASRTFGEPGTTSNGIVFDVSEEETFPVDAINDFIDIMTEEGNNVGKVYTSPDGTEHEVISNFSFEGTGEPIIFYPLYWNTSSFHALGIYWLDEDGTFNSQNMKDLYYTKSGELTFSEDYVEGKTVHFNSYCNEWNATAGEICPVHNLMTYQVSEGESLYASDALNTWSYLMAVGQKYHKEEQTLEGVEGTWSKADLTQTAAYDKSKVTGIKSKGIKLTVPKGLRYGFYLKVARYNSINPGREKFDTEGLTPEINGNGYPVYTTTVDGTTKSFYGDAVEHIVFSQSIRNQIYGTAEGAQDVWNCLNQSGNITNREWNNVPEGNEHVQASFLQIPKDGKTYSYFAFEDWCMDKPDLNDLVFIFDTDYSPTDIPVVDEDDPEPEDEWFEWILAAEDLGNVLCDWDFNDMVVKISVLAVKEDGVEQATTKLKVEPLASGGTLPVYLMYTGKIGNDTEAKTYVIGKEFHEWFGSSSLNPINVSKGSTASQKAEAITLDVPKSYTIAGLHEHYKPGEDGTNNMGGFWFIANRSDGMTEFNPTLSGNFTQIDVLPDNGKVNYIVAPDKESLAPQMICVEGSWMWPYESKFISEAYPEFEIWIKDASHTSWYKGADGNSKHTEGSVIKR